MTANVPATDNATESTTSAEQRDRMFSVPSIPELWAEHDEPRRMSDDEERRLPSPDPRLIVNEEPLDDDAFWAAVGEAGSATGDADASDADTGSGPGVVRRLFRRLGFGG
jgi:hypothetical protein